MTSHDVVVRARRALRIRQIGHFGTLDPFATGVLPLSVGKATRFAQFYLKSRKSYEGTLRFGVATDTYDASGRPTSEPSGVTLDRSRLETVFGQFTGQLMQVPPPFSAKRVGGVRAYDLARQQKPVELKPVEVEIYALELLDFDGERARFAVECSGGTYVRSLAHDIGKAVGSGAYLESLRRKSVAEFGLGQALTLEQLESLAGAAPTPTNLPLVPLEALLPDCLALMVRGREETSVRHGRKFEFAPAIGLAAGTIGATPIRLLKILNGERRLIAIARHVSGSIYHPDVVLV
jgi:tRNA pseudouridine55 synthase